MLKKIKSKHAPKVLTAAGIVYMIENTMGNMKGERKMAINKNTKMYLVKHEGCDFNDVGYGFDVIIGVYNDFEKAKKYVDDFVYTEDTSNDEEWLYIYELETNVELKDISYPVYERLIFKY